VERRFAVHARALALAATLVVLSGTAIAAPKKHAAIVQFQKGVAAYKKGAFDEASAAFGRSFKLEADQETLFAWAQAERKLDHCDRASELYTKLLAMKLPAENRTVVEQQLAECAALQPKPTEPAPTPEPTPPPAPPPAPPAPVATPAPAPAPLPQLHEDSPLAQPHDDTSEPEHRAWYRDPVGDSFTVVGVAGLAAGAGLLLSARSANESAHAAMTYASFQSFEDTAHSRGQTGVIAAGAGIAFIAVAAVWYIRDALH
jgi:hypothetical protein